MKREKDARFITVLGATCFLVVMYLVFGQAQERRPREAAAASVSKPTTHVPKVTDGATLAKIESARRLILDSKGIGGLWEAEHVRKAIEDEDVGKGTHVLAADPPVIYEFSPLDYAYHASQTVNALEDRELASLMVREATRRIVFDRIALRGTTSFLFVMNCLGHDPEYRFATEALAVTNEAAWFESRMGKDPPVTLTTHGLMLIHAMEARRGSPGNRMIFAGDLIHRIKEGSPLIPGMDMRSDRKTSCQDMLNLLNKGAPLTPVSVAPEILEPLFAELEKRRSAGTL